MSKFTYKIKKYDQEHEISTIMKGKLSEYDSESLATEAAEDFYDNYDGWECEWPMAIEIIIDGKSCGIVEVELENSPTFFVA